MLRHALLILALMLLAPMTGWADQDTDTPPEQVVAEVFDQSVNALLDNREAIRESPRVAFELIDETLSPWIHYPLMGQLILTRHWREATPEQRDAFLEAFREYVIRTYAAVLSDNVDTIATEVSRSGRMLEIQSVTEPDQRGRVVVRTQLRLENSSPIPVHYRMISTDDGWRVWDVVIENISFVTNYRDEYGSEIRRIGLDALIERLRERNARAWSGN
ncbi:MAG: ABC transporter substrate-binding protein [Ectothiorhodospiraceae bacterium]|nr:ABC transporter substrate-binding protein [Ectothiorhodospiraceae bacterium]